MLLTAPGGALELYDFFLAAVIGDLFFPPEMPEWLCLVQTFGIFAAGYLSIEPKPPVALELVAALLRGAPE